MNHEQIAHKWAHGHENTQYGNRRYNNVFSVGLKIYSYGYHFCMARKVLDKNGNVKHVLINRQSYSVSTSKHQSYVRRAIPADWRVIYCQNPENGVTKQDIDILFNEAKESLLKASKARTKGDFYKAEAKRSMAYAEMLKKEFVTSYRFLKWQKEMMNSVDSIEFMDTLRKHENAEAAKRRAIQRKVYAEQIERAKKHLKAWLNGYGEYISLPNYGDFKSCYLRIKDGHVDTSNSFSIPADEALKLFKGIKAGAIKKGMKVDLNGTEFGILRCDDELLEIGCHKIPMDECNRIGNQLTQQL